MLLDTKKPVMSEIARQLYASSLDILDLSLIIHLPVCGPNGQRSSCVAMSDCQQFFMALRWRYSSTEEVPHLARLELDLWGSSDFYAMEQSGDFSFPATYHQDDWAALYSDALCEARRMVTSLLSPLTDRP